MKKYHIEKNDYVYLGEYNSEREAYALMKNYEIEKKIDEMFHDTKIKRVKKERK